ncbi:hypothetical protein GCM10007386_09320 [Pseudoduganella dura]|nr:hypothetical protein GCM10007386_09320 [Pseudoduganella dura]
MQVSIVLDRGLTLERGQKGVYVQAVFPASTRTEIWMRAGIGIQILPDMMDVGELVDAALVGFDRHEGVTNPPLHVSERWDALDTARQALLGDLRQKQAAERYREGG